MHSIGQTKTRVRGLAGGITAQSYDHWFDSIPDRRNDTPASRCSIGQCQWRIQGGGRLCDPLVLTVNFWIILLRNWTVKSVPIGFDCPSFLPVKKLCQNALKLIILGTVMIFWADGPSISTTPYPLDTHGTSPVLTEILNTRLVSATKIVHVKCLAVLSSQSVCWFLQTTGGSRVEPVARPQM